MSARSLINARFVSVAVLTLVLGFTLTAHCQTNPPADKTVLIDFGNNISNRGTNTPSPDIHGHYWNSVWSGAYYGILTNVAGVGTTLALGFDFAPPADGTDSYNGPSGVCIDGTNSVPCPPSACIIDTNALGYLGINEAVYDYYVSSAFQIQGANPTKTYSLTFFGSHKFTDSDYTIYSLCDSSYSAITSVNLFVQSPSDPSAHNSNTVATISGVSPQPDGIFYIKFQGTNSSESFPAGYGVLNCMQIVTLSSTNTAVPPTPVDKTILVDFGNNQSGRTTNVLSPDGLGHYWNSVGGPSNFVPATVVLTNAAGAATTVQFAFDASNPAFTNAASGFGSDCYNGPSGAILFPPFVNPPSACVFDPSALGYLGITNAVYDYYVNAKFQLQGMETNKTYMLTFFGSHKFNPDPVTVYSVCSDGTYATVLASTNLLVGAGLSHNQDTVSTIGPISPQPNGTMYIKFMGSAGSLGYLNCLQIVDLSSTNAPPSNPFTAWQLAYFGSTNSANSLPSADPDGDGMSNTNEFLAGFNPTNSAAYPHIFSIAKAIPANLVITYLGASGDNTWSPGVASRTNVLEYTTGAPNGSYSNNFASTGQTNILSGGASLGAVTSFIETNAVTGATRYYRVRVLVP